MPKKIVSLLGADTFIYSDFKDFLDNKIINSIDFIKAVDDSEKINPQDILESESAELVTINAHGSIYEEWHLMTDIIKGYDFTVNILKLVLKKFKNAKYIFIDTCYGNALLNDIMVEDSEDSVLSQLTSKTQIIIRGPSDRSVWARTSDGESAVFQVIKNYISSNNPISSKMISDGECYSIIQKVDEDNLVAIKLDNSNINVFDDNKISDSLFCRQLKETENSESVLSKLYTYLASKLSVIEQDNALLARYKFHLFNSSLTKKDILNQNIEKYFNENISQMSDDQILASIVRTMVTLNYVSNDTTSVRYKLIQTLIHSKQIDLLTLENIFDLMSLGAEIGIPQSIFNALIQLTQINSLEKSKMQGMLLDYGFNQKYLEMIFEVYNLKNNQEVYSLIENTEDIFWFTKLCCSGDMSNLNSEFINNVFTTIQEKEIGKLCNNTAVKIINYIIEHDKSSEKIIIKNTLNFMYSQNIKIPYDTFIEIFKSLDDASIKNYIYDKLLTNKPDVSDAETGYNDIHGVINHNNLFSDMSTFSTNDNSTKIIGIIDSLINSFDEII